jgi:hypothetical protein
MVGGAPLTRAFADEIGADGFSDNASGAVRVARELVQPGGNNPPADHAARGRPV